MLGVSLTREILRLAVPSLGALLAEPIFLLVDAAIVGHLGTAQLVGVGIASTVLATLVGLSVFLAYGTTAAVARALGAGDLNRGLQAGIAGLYLAYDGLGGNGPRFSDLAREAATARDDGQLVAAAEKLHRWKETIL